MPERPGFTWCARVRRALRRRRPDAHYALDGPHIAISGRWTDEQRAREMAAPSSVRSHAERKKRGARRICSS